MKAVIYKYGKFSKRIKFYIPYSAVEWRSAIKAINSRFYHKDQKLWSIVNTDANLAKLLEIFGQNYTIYDTNNTPTALPYKELSEESLQRLESYNSKLILKGYSESTLKNYGGCMVNFFSYFEARKITELTKEDIESYLYHLKVKYKISNSKQNVIINAIKFYFEEVLNKPREYYNLQRPKKAISLPNVLSKEEVILLLDAPQNLKHKAILYTIYSAGLRISEVTKIRIEDIHKDDGYIFIKSGKAKKRGLLRLL